VAKLSREIPLKMKAAHVVGLSIALVAGDRTVWATYPGLVPPAGTLMIDHGVLMWSTSAGAKILVPAGSR
jgi:hypothetical protein